MMFLRVNRTPIFADENEVESIIPVTEYLMEVHLTDGTKFKTYKIQTQ